MTDTPDCIFCSIARGDAPSIRVYEDSHTVAFMDIRPSTEGHALVIPKAHAVDVFDATDDHVAAVARTARRVAGAIDRALRPEGLRVVQLNRRAAGQTVFHYHIHLVPARGGDVGKLHGREPGDLDAIRATAARIRAEL